MPLGSYGVRDASSVTLTFVLPLTTWACGLWPRSSRVLTIRRNPSRRIDGTTPAYLSGLGFVHTVSGHDSIDRLLEAGHEHLAELGIQPEDDERARIYNLFPSLVGSVGRWAAELPRIAALGFDWVYVNPFHETGYSGSLYAVKDYERLNPLFRGEDGGSDDDLLRGFVQAARAHGIGVMMDLVVNHTARDAGLTVERPNWYRRDAHGEIESPSASDPADPSNVTVWTDLAEIDYAERPERAEIVAYFAAVVRRYARLGIRGFAATRRTRCPRTLGGADRRRARDRSGRAVRRRDAGRAVRGRAGTAPGRVRLPLQQREVVGFPRPVAARAVRALRRIAPSIAFPESHDTPRVAAELAGASAARIEAEYKFRYLFAAFFSSGVMMPLGYEFGYERAVDVVMTRPEHREQPRFDLSEFVAEVNAMSPPCRRSTTKDRSACCGATAPPWRCCATRMPVRATRSRLINPDPDRDTSVPGIDLLRALGGAGAVEITPGIPQAPLPHDGGIALRPLEIRIFANAAVGARAGTDGSTTTAAVTTSADPRADARPVVIEAVWPEIDGGRHPVKRTVGERLEVEADIFREGHDAVAAVLKYRERGETGWRETPLRPIGNDRWRGAFALERNTRYEYALEGWPDPFGTWHHDVALKREAGQAIALELREGRALIEEALARASASDRTRLEATLAELDVLAATRKRAPRSCSATRWPS